MFSFLIMAHHSRKQFVPALQKEIRCPVSWDQGNLGLVDAHIQAWQMAYDTSEDGMCFVIQDDVILTEKFLIKCGYHVHNCQNRLRNTAMHLYLRNTKNRHVIGKVEMAKHGGRDYVLLPNVYSGNSIGMQRELIPDMLKHFKTMKVASGDKRINDFFRNNGIQVYFPLPNLVEHRSLPSLHAGNVSSHEYRKSIWFE